MSTYFDEMCRAMSLLAEQPRSVFLGQAVAHPGTSMSATLRSVPAEKLVEMPVTEDMQMGIATGMAIAGDLPVCIYPRWNFLLLAANQLVLHLDKLPMYSLAGYYPKVIIRTAIAAEAPLDPGAQHVGNFGPAFRRMLTTVSVVDLPDTASIVQAYREAMARRGSTILVERTKEFA